LFRAGDPVVPAGSVPACYLVLDGFLVQERSLKNGNSVYGLLTKGEFFGEEVVFGDKKRIHSVYVATRASPANVQFLPLTTEYECELVNASVRRYRARDEMFAEPTAADRIKWVLRRYPDLTLTMQTIANIATCSRKMVWECLNGIR
jgi:hypothetical protein